MRKKFWGIVCGILILATIYLLFFSNKEKSMDDDILNLNLREHKNIALHIHPILDIYILGKKQILPKDIGVSVNGMRVIHTHDESGKLHIEAPYYHQFYLKDFFTVWGKTFNSTCILDYCVDDKYKITVLVNGVENSQYGDIELKDQDRIKIYYEEK